MTQPPNIGGVKCTYEFQYATLKKIKLNRSLQILVNLNNKIELCVKIGKDGGVAL